MNQSGHLRILQAILIAEVIVLSSGAAAQSLPWESSQSPVENVLDADPRARLLEQLTTKEQELTDRFDQERERTSWTHNRLETRRNEVTTRVTDWHTERELTGGRLLEDARGILDQTLARLIATQASFDLLLEQHDEALDELSAAVSLVRTLRIGVEAGIEDTETTTLESILEELTNVELALENVDERQRVLRQRRDEVWERLTDYESQLDQTRTELLEIDRELDARDRAIAVLEPEIAVVARRVEQTSQTLCRRLTRQAREHTSDVLRDLALVGINRQLLSWFWRGFSDAELLSFPFAFESFLSALIEQVETRRPSDIEAAIERAHSMRLRALFSAADAVAPLTLDSEMGHLIERARTRAEIAYIEVQRDLRRREIEDLNLELEQVVLRRSVLSHWRDYWIEARGEAEARGAGGIFGRTRNAFSPASFGTLLDDVTTLFESPDRYVNVVTALSLAEAIYGVLVFLLLGAAYFLGRWLTNKSRRWSANWTRAELTLAGLRGFLRSAPISVIALLLLMLGQIPTQWVPLTWFAICLPLAACSLSLNRAFFPSGGNRRVTASAARYFRMVVRLTVTAFVLLLGARFALSGWGVQPASLDLVDGAGLVVFALGWALILGRKAHFLRLTGADDDVGLVKAGLRRLHLIMMLAPATLVILHIIGFRNLAQALFARGLVIVAIFVLGPWIHQRGHELVQKWVGFPNGGGPFRLESDGSLKAYQMLAPLVSVVLLLLGVTVVMSTWGHQGGLIDNINGAVTYPLLTVGNSNVTPLSILWFALTLVGALILKGGILRFLRRWFYSLYNVSAGRQAVADTFVTYLVVIMGILVGLQVIGIGLGVFAVFAGVVGIGIGFGSQALAANFMSGLILQVRGPLAVGDVIEIDGLLGKVTRISATWTVIQTRDNLRVLIPNSTLMGTPVTNWTREERHSRRAINVGVAYGSDVRRVTELLLKVARAHPKVLVSPEPTVQFSDFGSSSLDFILLIWLDDVLEGWVVGSEIRYEINRVFAENDITIPFPQRDLHLRSSQTSLEIAHAKGWPVLDESGA